MSFIIILVVLSATSSINALGIDIFIRDRQLQQACSLLQKEMSR